MPPILDLAIGVVFTFLLFSLVISALKPISAQRFEVAERQSKPASRMLKNQNFL